MPAKTERATSKIDRLTAKLVGLAEYEADRIQAPELVKVLDESYALSIKLTKAGGLAEIILQLFGRLVAAYGDLSLVKGKRILDIACGSSTSKAPALVHVREPFRTRTIRNSDTAGFSAHFEPWFCRMLLELGAQPVGVDIGDLDSEAFEHYKADLGTIGALDFLPDQSFDALQDSRLFGSPEFTAQFPHRAERLKIAAEIVRQERRLLKPGGIVIHSDAKGLIPS